MCSGCGVRGREPALGSFETRSGWTPRRSGGSGDRGNAMTARRRMRPAISGPFVLRISLPTGGNQAANTDADAMQFYFEGNAGGEQTPVGCRHGRGGAMDALPPSAQGTRLASVSRGMGSLGNLPKVYGWLLANTTSPCQAFRGDDRNTCLCPPRERNGNAARHEEGFAAIPEPN